MSASKEGKGTRAEFDPKRGAQILMCPPDYYGIEYEINPWMSRQKQADPDLAHQQWTSLRDLIQAAGATVLLMDAVQGVPDLVFTANAALVFRQQAVLASFRYPQRQKEELIDQAWLETTGFTVRRLAAGVFFEGAGDALFCGETLIAGYRIRSDVAGHQEIGRMLGCQVLPLELVDPYYYHLDTCFCPLAPGLAIYYPPAFDHYGRRVLEQSVQQLVPVNDAEAKRFACNAVVIGRKVITNVGCRELHATLLGLDFEPWETPLDEFVKAGGSAKCLTLRLDGEEAAEWKN